MKNGDLDMMREEFLLTKEEQQEEELKRAAKVIKDICDRRMMGEACSTCPFFDMCRTAPYSWEV